VGHLAKPAGRRLGGSVNLFWSENFSFFYNKKKYKKTLILFRYLNIVFCVFQKYLRRIGYYRLLSTQHVYNIGGLSSEVLRIDFSFFDYFNMFSTISKPVLKKNY